MNTHFKRWIGQAVDELDGIFTVHQVLEKIVEMKGTSMYIGHQFNILRTRPPT